MIRLLTFGDDNSLVFKQFWSETPPYAILSHTWHESNEEEVTYDNLRTHEGFQKAGWRKIEFCMDQVRIDGLEYFWIDTCCINRRSEPELTEAINTMFRWYKEATMCYVYLADVEHAADWGYSFKRSRWFTRGWTLQELIAPPLVEFFSLEGKRLSDKKSLERQVHEIAGLALWALQGSALFEFSVAERMSWAEKRETKREEDIAYSLLGIFDIHMPLIYGEGMKNAFRRLREEIDKCSSIDRSRLLSSEISTQSGKSIIWISSH